MVIDKEEFINEFLFELDENIRTVEVNILILKKDPDNEEDLNEILRALHTIKGAARMLQYNNIEQLTHGMENIFKGIKEKRYTVTKPFIQLTFIATDHLNRIIENIKKNRRDDLPSGKLLAVFDKVYANEPYSLAGLEEKESSGAIEKKTNTPEAARKPETGITSKGNLKKESNTIRIKTGTVDKIIKSVNNLIIKQFQLKKENETISDLEKSILRLSETASSQALQNSKFRKQKEECLKLVQNLKKDFSDKIDLIERNTFEVQEDIFSLRMLPLGLILNTLGKMVEETAQALGKEINLDITGADVMLDKTILEKIQDPLIHLIRNAIDHGIEKPKDRIEAGKKKSGSISVNCYAESGNIMIKIKDDGRGFDYKKIREKALVFYPAQTEEIKKMSDDNLNSFLFMPGFSTKQDVSSISGRGIGLDIVGYNIEKIKGKVNVKSKKNKGSEFILSLPLSLATVEGFFVRSAEEAFLIPSNFVKELLIINEKDIFELLNKRAIKLRDKVIPVYFLAAIMKKEYISASNKLFVIIVESLGEMIGIIVDSIIQYASLIYKPLPPNLMGVKAIQGIVFDESFNIINILYVPEIINRFKAIRNIESRKRYSKDKTEYKHILIVDDSYSTREIEKSILELENYNVTTAIDGIEGLEKLKEKYFHLIITDIQMPRMDGFLFLENLRRDERYRKTPVIVISSLDNKDEEEKFLEAGADSFIIKSEFDRNNLVAAVKDLLT